MPNFVNNNDSFVDVPLFPVNEISDLLGTHIAARIDRSNQVLSVRVLGLLVAIRIPDGFRKAAIFVFL